ncbi:protein-glutamine gamma-glutamyltransferase 2-like isoform X2 [Mugil cephalus]|uniref:protein-glutamine gamma-glutamyltransferase 2-like isoform X2 n=1 Tax=Mugil cephalus TaxID=48193 RepID=UPI001FB7F61A|nr:protein-glutamine gamma-glutamyltransferase 2-like isoform X2 [Mugil cephalus]
MDCMQQETYNYDFSGTDNGHHRLRLVNFEVQANHTSHETQGLSNIRLVVRRGKPFKLTLLFHSQAWDPHTEGLVLEVCLGDLSEKIPVQFSSEWSNPQRWSATVYPENLQPQSVTIHICSPVLSSVGLYDLLIHINTLKHRLSYTLGRFVLLCNPWLKDDPVYMPLDDHLQEYIKNDYGVVYTGTNSNICRRPWVFGQYEPGVLEACLKLLQVSPQHFRDSLKDYSLRADPVYLSRVVCAMVNCNDDLGILEGKWQGSYKGGVRPTDWSGSADILRRWFSSNCIPVRYGQCWVYASVLCTVMRVLGVPSRVVTVFNAAHDSDGSLKVEEYYTSRGEKLGLSKDSIWNFHVWAECWMRRPDLGAGFDGWQVVDPTPQEKSAGIFCCGPCPVTAVQQHCLGAPYDTPFIYASVNADIIRLIVRDGLVVGRTVDTDWVGQLIYTKKVGSDNPVNLIHNYKGTKEQTEAVKITMKTIPGQMSPSLEVTLTMDRVPSLGDSIHMCVTVTNRSNSPRVLMELVNAQLKEYNSTPQGSFWKVHKKVHIQPHEVLTLHHIIPHSEYDTVLAGDDIVNLAVVIKDVMTNKRVLATQEFNVNPPQITIEIEGGDSIQMKKKHTALVSFTNQFIKPLTGALLTVEGFGLLQSKQESRLVLLQPGEKIEKKVSIVASSPGTKLLLATFSHSKCPTIVSRSFHKVSVTTV